MHCNSSLFIFTFSCLEDFYLFIYLINFIYLAVKTHVLDLHVVELYIADFSFYLMVVSVFLTLV